MGTDTNIEWADDTWTPFVAYVGDKRGWFCTHASPGCANCYAERWNGFRGNGLAYIAQNEGNVTIALADNLYTPLKQGRPRSIFVNSMTDTFHPLMTTEMLDTLFAVMALADRHTFFVLTKRADRMAAYLNDLDTPYRVYVHILRILGENLSCLKSSLQRQDAQQGYERWKAHWWPLDNVLLGVSAENDEWAQKRIPALLSIPWPFHWVSYEPALGPIEWRREWLRSEYDRYCCTFPFKAPFDEQEQWAQALDTLSHARVDWIVYGGESTQGKPARPADIAWARQTRDALEFTGCTFFCKQLGSSPVRDLNFNDVPNDLLLPVAMPFNPADKNDHYAKLLLHDKKGGDMAEWPADLRIRQLPVRVRARLPRSTFCPESRDRTEAAR